MIRWGPGLAPSSSGAQPFGKAHTAQHQSPCLLGGHHQSQTWTPVNRLWSLLLDLCLHFADGAITAPATVTAPVVVAVTPPEAASPHPPWTVTAPVAAFTVPGVASSLCLVAASHHTGAMLTGSGENAHGPSLDIDWSLRTFTGPVGVFTKLSAYTEPSQGLSGHQGWPVHSRGPRRHSPGQSGCYQACQGLRSRFRQSYLLHEFSKSMLTGIR